MNEVYSFTIHITSHLGTISFTLYPTRLCKIIRRYSIFFIRIFVWEEVMVKVEVAVGSGGGGTSVMPWMGLISGPN